MKNECAIVQDLLPLYEEQLLHPETEDFIEEHLKTCYDCRQLAKQSHIPLPVEVESGASSKKMIKKITLRLATVQLFFVTTAFILAMLSTINTNASFILTYTILGVVTYLFYRSAFLAGLLASIPAFIWNSLIYMTDIFEEFYVNNFFEGLTLVLFSVGIYLIFTFIGVFIGFCILKIREKDE